MKILWLSHLVPYPPKSGVLQRSYNLVKEVAKHHELSLLSFIQTDQLRGMFGSVEEGLAEARDHLNEYCEKVQFVDIPCERTRMGKNMLAARSLFTRDPYTINWLKSPEMLQAVRDANNEDQYELIHFDTISLAPYASEFPTLPKVLDHHNIESHMMLRRAEQETNFIKHLYFYQEGKKLLSYEKKVCPSFNLHITCSSLDSNRLQDIDDSLNIEEIPNGVDIEYFQPQHENEIPGHLIFAGGLNWYPNADAMSFLARKIWPLLKNNTQTIVMNVVGKSPPAELIELSRNDSDFRVHGFVDDVRDYISASSVYVCPIRDGGGTKLKLLDAFAMGMATVAHPVACEGIDVTDKVNILLADTPEEFARNISLLVSNREMRRSIGKSARTLATEKYAFSQIGENLSSLYTGLISKSY